MSLRATELAQVVEEVAAGLKGAVVQKAWCPLPSLCYLELRVPGRSLLLCLCADLDLSRISVAPERFPTPGEPATFQRWLRQELTGFKWATATYSEALRTARLDFEKEGQRRSLLLSLGATRGLILLHGDERVLMLSGEGLMGKRGLHPGSLWPPAAASPAPAAAPAQKQPSRLNALVQARPADWTGPFLPLAEAAERLLGEVERVSRADNVRKRLALPYRARLKRGERTLAKVLAEAAREPEALKHRRVGELLSQNLHRLRRGQKDVQLTEYTEEGVQELTLNLDPRRSPQEEVAWHFHQYRRFLRGVEHAKHRALELGRELKLAREALEELDGLDDASLLAQLPVLQERSAAAPSGKGSPYKEYEGHGAQAIWVGRGAADNDALTFKVARPFHIWFHARGVPGSHVVVPLERGVDLNQELLLDAAHLAAHHSNYKGEPRAEVSYLPVRMVRKVKGGQPGQVLFSGEKTLVVRLEPARLERLLKSRRGADER